MKLNNFIEGLKVLQPYYTKTDGFHIGAEHDIFYAYATDRPLSEADQTRMFELGWVQPDVEEGEDEEHGPYAPEEGWAADT